MACRAHRYRAWRGCRVGVTGVVLLGHAGLIVRSRLGANDPEALESFEWAVLHNWFGWTEMCGEYVVPANQDDLGRCCPDS